METASWTSPWKWTTCAARLKKRCGAGRIKFPINEPAAGRRRSQIDEYLDFYHGPGVQHIALATGNIIETVRAMRDNDVSFLRVPNSYYDMLSQRVGDIKEPIEKLA